MNFFIALTSFLLIFNSIKKPVSTTREDSLYHIYLDTKDPKDKLPVLWELIQTRLDKEEFEECLKYTERYLHLSSKYGKKEEIGQSYWAHAFVSHKLKNFNVALEYYLKAEPYFVKQERYDGIGAIYNNIGNILNNTKEFELAREYYFKAIETNKRTKNFHKLTMNYYNLTRCELNSKNYEQSVIYAERGLEFAKELLSSRQMNNLINLKGVAYYYRQDYEKARELYFDSIVHIDSAENKARRLGIAYNNIGETYREQNDYETAKKFFKEALWHKKEYGDIALIASTFINLSKLALLENQPREAISYLDETFKILNNDRIYPELKEASELLVKAYKNKTDFSAKDIDKILNLNQEYLNYIDKLKLEENQKITALVMEQGEIEGQAQYLQQKAKNIQNQAVWVLSLSATAILGLLILLHYRERRFKDFIQGMWEDIKDV